mgnify:CR=1 FL=1
MCLVPYLARLWFFWRAYDEGGGEGEAELRVLVTTAGEGGERTLDNCLETREGFTLLSGSPELVIRDRSELELRISGNLTPLAGQTRLVFKPFRENRSTFPVRRIQVYKTFKRVCII